MTIDALLCRLEGVKRAGPGYSAICPAHHDQRQSLTVRRGDKGIVLKCHAGCATEQVVSALGLKMKDLFFGKAAAEKPEPDSCRGKSLAGARSERSRIVAEYDYTDEKGGLLFQVVRFDPKDFRQRQPDQDKAGGWSWSTAGVRKVLFHLPMLVAGPRQAEDPLLIVEGEKDVLALESAGWPWATCNPGGAGKWLQDYKPMLTKWRRIVIVADADEPGRKHARQVAAALADPGRVIKIIEVPQGKDVADFIGRGGTVQALLELAERVNPHAAPEPLAPVTNGSHCPAPALPDLPPCVFETTRQRFYIPAGKEWIPVSESRAAVYFRQAGFSDFIKDSFGVSVLEAALQKVVLQRNVLFAGQIAGWWPGPVTVAGQRMLITRGPELITPKEGAWETLRQMLEQMLIWPEAPEPQLCTRQWDLFCGWVWTAYESLRDRTFRPGLVLTLCGKMGSGKSVLQGLITLLLGGRSANPYGFLTGRTEFNLDLIGAEHLTIDDDASERDFKSRQAFGQRIKKLAVADTVSLHGKGRDAVTVKTYCRVSICINDDPQDLMVLPPMEDSVREKFLLLKIRPATFPEMKEAQEFSRFKSQLVAELPAFLHYLQTKFEIPKELKSPRYGVCNWQHPELLLDLEALHPWQRLIELIDYARPWAEDGILPGREVWEGTVQDLEDVLRQRAPSRAMSVLRGPQGTGMDLHCAMQRLPRRISKRQSMGRTIWIIRKSAA